MKLSPNNNIKSKLISILLILIPIAIFSQFAGTGIPNHTTVVNGRSIVSTWRYNDTGSNILVLISNILLPVELVFNVLNKVVINKEMNPGSYEAIFDGKDFSSGVYFYRIEADGFVKSAKMVLTK